MPIEYIESRKWALLSLSFFILKAQRTMERKQQQKYPAIGEWGCWPSMNTTGAQIY